MTRDYLKSYIIMYVMAPVTGSESLEPRHAGPVAGILPYLPGMHKQRARSEPGVGRKIGLMPHRSLRITTQGKRKAVKLQMTPGSFSREDAGITLCVETRTEHYQAGKSEEKEKELQHRQNPPMPEEQARISAA